MFNLFKSKKKEEIRTVFNELFLDYTNEFDKANHELQKNTNSLNMFPNGGFQQSALAKSFFGSFFGSNNNMLFETSNGLQSYFKSVYDYAAVYHIANTIASLPVKLFRKTKGGREEVPRGTNEEAEKILTMPNDFTTWYDYIEGTVTLTELGGSSFHEVVFAPSPKELFLISPATVEVLVNREGIKGFKITNGGHVVILDTEEMFQIKYFNPLDFHRGFTPYTPMKTSLTNDFYMHQFMSSFFENGGNVGGILSSSNPIPERNKNNIKTQFEEKFSGASKAFKLMVLGGGLTYTKTAVNPSEADITNLRKDTRLDILTGRGVPPILLGFLDGASYSNADVQIKIYFKSTIRPKSIKVQEKLNRAVFSKFGLQMEFDFSNIQELQENKLDNAKVAVEMAKAGTFSIDEVRKESFGFEPVTGGEVLALPPQTGGQSLFDKSRTLNEAFPDSFDKFKQAKSNLVWKRKQLLEKLTQN